jgi:ribulose-phosphate 3-epimerase
MVVLVAPSILSADFAALGDECERMVACGADWLHIDVMDGHFVPNLTLGPMVVRSLRRRLPSVYLDVHLMVVEGARWAKEFAAAGASSVTVHYEAFPSAPELTAFLKEFREAYRHVSIGVAIKPGTPLRNVINSTELLALCDMVLVMTVEPGFGGQQMMTSRLSAIGELRRNGYTGLVQVDGGVNLDNCRLVVEAGADVVVSGTAIFGASDPATVITNIKSL